MAVKDGCRFRAWPIVGRGENGHFVVRGGHDKECVPKLSWPSTAEYRMMKLKKDFLHANYFLPVHEKRERERGP